MRISFYFLATLFIPSLSYCQKMDTIRIYDYSNMYHQWKLETFNNKLFTYVDRKYIDTSSGYLSPEGNGYSLVVDSNGISPQTLRMFKWFRNEIQLLNLNCYNVITPMMIIKNPIYIYDTANFPDSIFATYYRGERFVSYLLQLNQDHSYSFIESGDVGGSDLKENGTWTIKHNVITFKTRGNHSMLTWFTKKSQLFLLGNFLVGRKIDKTRTQYSESYFYFLKQPEKK